MMRHLPTRSTRHRVVGALAAAPLCAAGLGTPAVAADAPATPAGPAAAAAATKGRRRGGLDSDHADRAGLRIGC
ncbi:hypothetical protein HRW23_07165 [Streptomyces lunaelactis]|uniref:hypothetical protein n=1 Tax=Streptomyces lunaelactis TaxID=1535768 RepID=UPI001585ABA7|nr:hypothetical protein [Streptomyces lunaelactis]NUK02475.1 hypothetical protein [Streptomyces lunaelactis]NUK72771.1 hypothetical protein [Streptomyces lunaelactis]NUK77189.1 hypothetical protein [Streptomyces lunaelactis]